MKNMLPCQALFGMSRGAQIIQAVEEDTGQLCPCKRGLVCPLMPSAELESFPDAGESLEHWLASPGPIPQGGRHRRVS